MLLMEIKFWFFFNFSAAFFVCKLFLLVFWRLLKQLLLSPKLCCTFANNLFIWQNTWAAIFYLIYFTALLLIKQSIAFLAFLPFLLLFLGLQMHGFTSMHVHMFGHVLMCVCLANFLVQENLSFWLSWQHVFPKPA